jgi:CDP-diacylglycerol--serine O-phosphatidyltransferase
MAMRVRPRLPRRGAYILPSLFTVGNIFCGYFALTEAFKGAVSPEAAAAHLDAAAKAIGLALLLDGFDGRVARLTNTTSAFGREFDSLADAITFGVAPALLALVWGIRWIDPGAALFEHLQRIGWVLGFLFVICGAARLARFNITTDPLPANPGQPGRKYFVGLPIPSAAGLLAAVVHVVDGEPLYWWAWSVLWLSVLMTVSLLMVSRWRYFSFKDIDLRRRHPLFLVVSIAGLVAAIWFYSEPVLLFMAAAYVMSGVIARAGGILRRMIRRLRPRPLPPQSDLPAGA